MNHSPADALECYRQSIARLKKMILAIEPELQRLSQEKEDLAAAIHTMSNRLMIEAHPVELPVSEPPAKRPKKKAAKKGHRSGAARNRIAEAQKKRWELFRKQKAAANTAVRPNGAASDATA